jgi:hypothetical protein
MKVTHSENNLGTDKLDRLLIKALDFKDVVVDISTREVI